MGKTGLVLQGGAMRGLFTCGVLDVLMEKGISFDGICGISAGAAFGCNYKSGQPGRALRYNTTYCQDRRYFGWGSLLRTGDLFNAEFCYHTLPFELDIWDTAAFMRSPVDFYAGAFNIHTGETEFHLCGKAPELDLLFIRASASMPFFSRPVRIGDQEYLDGGIRDPIPLKWMEQQGYDHILVVETQPKGYRKSPSPLTSVSLPLLSTPALKQAFMDRARRYNEQKAYVEQREKEGLVQVIRPAGKLPVRHAERDPQRLQAAYAAGRAEALNNVKLI